MAYIQFFSYLCIRFFDSQNMGTIDNKLDLRIRSNRASITDGYRLYIGNFRSILGHTWLFALILALIQGVSTTWIMNTISSQMIARLSGTGVPMPSPIESFASLGMGLLLLVSQIALIAQVFTLLAEHQATGIISKSLKWYGSFSQRLFTRYLLISFIIALLPTATGAITLLGYRYLGLWAGFALILVNALLLFVLLMPLPYMVMKYMVNAQLPLFSRFSEVYAAGFRRWGAHFVVVLITMIITLLALLITELPTLVLTVATARSTVGSLQGDPAGMPDYMTWMSAIVFFIAGFIQAYLQLSVLFPCYYLYGTIEAQQEERNNLQLDQHEKNTVY